ncbi:F0F1 ATP synthase subunit epsilon, partial [Anaerostipes hadrus]|uniref:F0F1 ATP synthase subunit epsilon n=1 Tax=Anaerostipes hadrus TaxID=649756 RepID=UPI00306429E4|nr:F0F1 ATP synthase subunit epsilon [Anaerostipes hadrus]
MTSNFIEVITPVRSFYTGSVTFVELNTIEGEVGIYARHIPMTMIIAPGVLTITEEDGT